VGVNALRDIILLIINLHMKYSGRGLGRTKLMKLLFLIDHDAIKEKLGKSVTGLKWYKWFYGPFSNGVYPELNKLLGEGYMDLKKALILITQPIAENTTLLLESAVTTPRNELIEIFKVAQEIVNIMAERIEAKKPPSYDEDKKERLFPF